VSIDTSRAEAMPGVQLVLTHLNAPPQAEVIPGCDHTRCTAATDDRRDRALWSASRVPVVADTFEQARAAAALIEIGYEVVAGEFVLDENLGRCRMA